MTTYVRIYATEEGAKAAAARLAKAGLHDNKVFLASQATGKASEVVESAVKAGELPKSQTKICIESLKKGHSLVSTEAPFGSGQKALSAMESEGTVESDVLSRYTRDDPAPLSEALGIPVLSNYEPSTGLLSSNWSLSSKFGLGLLSNKATPLSSMFGLPVLSKPKRDWRRSFGLPLLSNNPAPFSSLFGMPTLSKEPKDWNSSFGLPLLSDNPAPLSRLFGLKTIIKD